jgi:hypothetical protein
MTAKWTASIDRVRFWRHALQVAIGARLIAEQLGYKNPEEAFVCGLLHDMGVLFMEKTAPGPFKEIWARVDGSEDLSADEERRWRALHSQVGCAFLEKWNFPGVICHVLGEHHNEACFTDTDEEGMLIRIVALANLVSPFSIPRRQKMLPSDRKAREALRVSLHLPPKGLKQIVKMLLTQTLAEAEFLEIDIGSQDDYLRDANRIIYEQYILSAEALVRRARPADGSMDEVAKEKILSEARRVIGEQYLTLKEKIQKDWRQTEVVDIDEKEALPDCTQCIHIISTQYIAMDNLLREVRDKVVQPT